MDKSFGPVKLPPEQAVRAKCFHPTGTFIEFKKEEIEQSIPERFENIVALYPDRMSLSDENAQKLLAMTNQGHASED